MDKEYIEKDSIIKFIAERLSSPDESKQFGHNAVEILAEIEFMESADVRPVQFADTTKTALAIVSILESIA